MPTRAIRRGAMNRLRTLVHDERGVALVMALTILATLTGLVLAFLSVSAFEPQISRNHVDGVQARQVAEAGIEYAYKTLTTNYNTWNNFLAGATCTTGAVMGAANTTLPGLSAAHGTFTVRLRNDCKANDNKITGVLPVESVGNATNDTNNILILASTGTIGNTTRTITVAISKIDFNITGALSFPGLQSDVNFSGSAFTIDGRSYKMIDSPGNPSGLDGNNNPVTPVYGISVNANLPANELLIETALQNNQQNVVRGKDETNPSAWTQGANTVETDPTQTSLMITKFVEHMKKYADITHTPPTGTGYSIQNVGSTCSTNPSDSACWGTTSTPKIVYIKGDLPNPQAQITSLSVSGTSVGTGILIVENGNFEISGNFRWNGPIIVTGNNVGIRYLGGGFQSVYGTAIVNEMNNNEAPNLEGEVTGNASLLYSRDAIDTVRNALINRYVKTYSWSDQ
jgi:Tfp pilus assembly protein PilX